jgi:hypothetical protein
MNISNILLLAIICIIFLLIINFLFINISESILNKKEHINNNLPDNQITQEGDNNLLIPTSDQIYNPNDVNRPDNQYSHQETTLNNINNNTDFVDTDPSIPIVYSNDELEVTSIPLTTPSSYIIDAGSGQIKETDNINNNKLNNFNSIE